MPAFQATQRVAGNRVAIQVKARWAAINCTRIIRVQSAVADGVAGGGL